MQWSYIFNPSLWTWVGRKWVRSKYQYSQIICIVWAENFIVTHRENARDYQAATPGTNIRDSAEEVALWGEDETDSDDASVTWCGEGQEECRGVMRWCSMTLMISADMYKHREEAKMMVTIRISWSKLSFEMKIHQIYHHTFNLSTLFLFLSPVWWIISNDSCLRSLSNADDCQGLQMSPTHDLSSLFISWSVVTSGQTLQLLPFSNHSHINTVPQ